MRKFTLGLALVLAVGMLSAKEKPCSRQVGHGYQDPDNPNNITYSRVKQFDCMIAGEEGICITCELPGDNTCPKCPGEGLITGYSEFHQACIESMFNLSESLVASGVLQGYQTSIFFNTATGTTTTLLVSWIATSVDDAYYKVEFIE